MTRSLLRPCRVAAASCVLAAAAVAAAADSALPERWDFCQHAWRDLCEPDLAGRFWSPDATAHLAAAAGPIGRFRFDLVGLRRDGRGFGPGLLAFVDEPYRPVPSDEAGLLALLSSPLFFVGADGTNVLSSRPPDLSAIFRPPTPDERRQFLALMPAETNRADRLLVCHLAGATIDAPAPVLELPAVAEPDGIRLLAPRAWRFSTAPRRRWRGDVGLDAHADFVPERRSAATDAFAAAFRAAADAGDAAPLVARLLPEARSPRTESQCRELVRLARALREAGVPVRLRFRFPTPIAGGDAADIDARLLAELPRGAPARRAAERGSGDRVPVPPSLLADGLWLVADLVFRTNGAPASVASFHVLERDGAAWLLPPARQEGDPDAPTAASLRERWLADFPDSDECRALAAWAALAAAFPAEPDAGFAFRLRMEPIRYPNALQRHWRHTLEEHLLLP